jgi:hypothetical protein
MTCLAELYDANRIHLKPLDIDTDARKRSPLSRFHGVQSQEPSLQSKPSQNLGGNNEYTKTKTHTRHL